MKLNNSNSIDYDGLNINIIKYVHQYILEPFTYTFNLCISKGIYPEKTKYIITTPIYKQGEKIK